MLASHSTWHGHAGLATAFCCILLSVFFFLKTRNRIRHTNRTLDAIQSQCLGPHDTSAYLLLLRQCR